MASGCCCRALKLCHLEQMTFLHSGWSTGKKPLNSLESFLSFDKQGLEIFSNEHFLFWGCKRGGKQGDGTCL